MSELKRIGYEELKDQKSCIFGIQGSGKTYFIQNMCKHFKKPIVFQVNDDDNWTSVKGMTTYKANRNKLKEDFSEFIQYVRNRALKKEIDLIIIDEADLFFRSNYHIEENLNDLVLNHRHLGVALWFVTRRPQDIPTKIVESSKFLIIFKLEGKNAIQRFYDIHPLTPVLIEALDYKKHDFVIKELGEEPILHKPL